MPTIDERQELAKKADLATKQNTLIPGTGITIVNDVISSTGGSTVTVSPTLSSGTPIAAITVDGNINTLFAPTPPTISVTQTQLSGDELATITVNGTPFTIYAPEGTVVLSGTSAPTSAQGENGDLYVQYTVTSSVYTVDMTYVKLSGEWVELATSGSEVEANPQGAATDTLNKIDIDGTIYSVGGGLSNNWEVTDEHIKGVVTSSGYNELGWKVLTDTYYTEQAISWTNNGYTCTKYNTKPALCGFAGIPGSTRTYYEAVLVSTDPTGTYYYDRDGYTLKSSYDTFTYQNHTWYCSNSFVQHRIVSITGLTYIGDFTTFEEAAKWLIDHSDVIYNDAINTFTQVSLPSTDHLFAGGGSQSDLSDATFDVEADGTVHATDFQIGNTSIMTPFTGATSLVDGELGMVPAPEMGDETKFLCGDGTWHIINSQPGLGYKETVLWENTSGTTSSSTITLSSALDNYDAIYIITASNAEPNYRSTQIIPVSAIDTTGTTNFGIFDTGADNYYYVVLNYVDSTHITLSSWGSSYPIKYYKVVGINYGAGGTPIQPIIYSEEEREVGVWTDGKPLYQKTSLVNITSGTNTLDTITNGENIRVIEAFAIYNNIQLLNLNYFNSSNDKCTIYTNQNNIYCETVNSFAASYTKVLVTYQYTKTTDTPGSGIWTPQGVPAAHYSTDEQVVGTWIDGDTLYEKTITFTAPSNNYVIVATNIVNFNKCISYSGIVMLGSGLFEDIQYNRPDSNNSTYYTAIMSTGDIFFKTFEATTGTVYITMRYTKSTS